MRINYIILEGFKIFKERVRIDLYKKTLIKGENFHGKTSIAEAIAYGFCGVSLNGEIRNIEDLINNECSKMKVEINFTDDNGQEHTLLRIKDKKNQAVYLDGGDEPTTQNNINNFIGDPKLFLSCFNLGFFQKELEDSDKRKLIVQYAPAVDMKRLFGEYAPVELIDKYSIELNKQSEYTRLNKLKTETENAIKEFEVKIQMLTSQNEDDSNFISANSSFVSNDKNIELEENLKKEYENLYNLELSNSKIKAEYNVYNKEVEFYNQIVAKFNNIASKIKERGLDINKYPVSFNETQEYSDLNNEKMALSSELATLPTEKTCRTCGNSITNELFDKSQIRIKKISERLGQIEALIKSRFEADKENSSLYMELSKYSQNVSRAPEKPSGELYDTSSLPQIKAQYEKVFADNADFKIKNSEVSVRMQEINKRTNEIASIQVQKDRFTNQYNELIEILKALVPSSGIFRKSLEIKSKFIKDEFDKCSIILEREQKNGEVKECFEIFYKEKPYRRLSYSEQMLCSLEIAKFLKNQSRRNFPVFVDNKESILNIDKDLIIEADQQIYCVVEAGSELQVIEKE